AAQRDQSQRERKSKKIGVSSDDLADTSWVPHEPVNFVGYDTIEADTVVTAFRQLPEGRAAVMLRETPFYVESGGQVSDRGTVTGEGWSLSVEEVRKIDGRPTVIGKADGHIALGPVRAVVPRDARLDTERNHTATHLLHAALRDVLGDHVHQAGSLVAPDRLRFDFMHHGPMTDPQIQEVEDIVNRGILAAVPLDICQRPYDEAVAGGAMALFGEKYGDVVRVVTIPGLSVELCGGTHVRNTSEIALFQIVGETGVAAGVRRIEAVTGPRAYDAINMRKRTLAEVADILRSSPAGVVRRLHSIIDERRTLEKKLEEAIRGGGSSGVQPLIDRAVMVDGVRVIAAAVPAMDMKSLQGLGDVLREKMESGVAVLSASFGDGKNSLIAMVTDDLRQRGLRADNIIRDVAAVAGGRGGGKPHMAQAGIPDAARLPDALAAVAGVVQAQLAAGTGS
ncbi:MAG: DHHA1 domain-containing protein, partial [Gemmatimonadota bacterium]|nr:DHHA1 domain-containing protein [Gemmatimonadota bacterium]